MLSTVNEAEFSVLRDGLTVSDSALSEHLKVLEEAGYLVLKKATVASRVRTRAALTKAGRRAYAGHVAGLQRLVADDPESILSAPG